MSRMFCRGLTVWTALLVVQAGSACADEKTDFKKQILGSWQRVGAAIPVANEPTLAFTEKGKVTFERMRPEQTEWREEATYEIAGSELKVTREGLVTQAEVRTYSIESLSDRELVLRDGKGPLTRYQRSNPVQSPDASPYRHFPEVIYGRKHGMALTMDIFAPKRGANGRGIVWCISGGWFSSRDFVNVAFAKPFLDRGYTVFQVVHGSQPRYAIPEVVDDIHRAVRFIKANAEKYQVDPDLLGIGGGSAGGHLSLMLGCAPRPGKILTLDAVERQTSRVAAVACFFPPTDFLNFGREGEIALGSGPLKDFQAPFDFQELDAKSNRFVSVTDEAKRRAIGKSISPAQFVSKDSAPALIIHGDADRLVPIQQSHWIIAKLKDCQVPCELVIHKGAGHGGIPFVNDGKILADWFDKHLLKK